MRSSLYAIVALMGFLPLGLTSAIGKFRSRSLDVTRMESPLSNLDGVPHCDEIVAQATNDTSVQRFSCYTHAASDDEAPLKSSIEARQLGAPVCARGGTPPDSRDAGILCEGLPDSVFLLPGSIGGFVGGNSCNCETWLSWSARWTVCNCDFCASASIANLQDACHEINSECINNPSTPYSRGYVSSASPPIWATLYGESQDVGFSPVPAYCPH